MTRWLREKYPSTAITFYDAAIGGTGSQLGMFRLERDVLSRKPDLVFLDFTVNDWAEGTDPQALGSYERIVRELLANKVMVMPVLMMFRGHAEKPDAPLPARHQAHLKLADAYSLPSANTVPYASKKSAPGRISKPCGRSTLPTRMIPATACSLNASATDTSRQSRWTPRQPSRRKRFLRTFTRSAPD